MWSSIENLKQNLNQIAHDVHSIDDDEDLTIYDRRNGYGSPVSSSSPISVSSSNRRMSNRFTNSNSSLSIFPNGNDTAVINEIEQYKNEIRRLKDSESELKTLSVNYSALIKEKEDLISRLDQENGILKDKMKRSRESLTVSRHDNSRTSTTSGYMRKESGDQSPARHQKAVFQSEDRNFGNYTPNDLKQDVIANGGYSLQSNKSRNMKQELADSNEEENKTLSSLQATHELQMQNLRRELDKEHDQLATLHSKLQEEQQLSRSLREELRTLELEKKKISVEMGKIHNESNQKTTEIKRLQTELSRLNDDTTDESVESLKRVMTLLQTENSKLKTTNNELKVRLENNRSSSPSISPSTVKTEVEASPLVQELNYKLEKLEKDLKQTAHERDKTSQELKRLKQHLLEKESEEAEKMDEDSKLIDELHLMNENLRTQVSQLEKALKHAVANREEAVSLSKKEIEESKKLNHELNKQLADCKSTIVSKNVELLNLQSALGQYFAEVEGKEFLERQLALTRENSSKLSSLLKNAEEEIEACRREKEELASRLSQSGKMVAEENTRAAKLAEDNSKLRRALEEGINRLNRMSLDSDYLVDRRIVIKLLVTYFQRNHSKEVLDLMVRMLGFSDDDKRRIGVAQHGGKGVVRGVLGLPGRVVGGIMGGSSANSVDAADNQSIADLWVDFLLKETEDREKRGGVETDQTPSST